MGAPLYTVAECQTEVRRIDALIKELSEIPVQQGGDGLYASYAGRLTDLRKEREAWIERLEAAEAYYEDGAPHLMQGPRFKV